MLESKKIKAAPVERLARRRGTAVLEMAIVGSLLFLITFGTIEFAYCFFVKNTMDAAAREGCRAGIVAGATMSSVNYQATLALSNSQLVTGTSSSTSNPLTYDNFTITAYDVNPTTGAKTVATSGLTNVNVGDGLEVDVTATWGVVGGAFRPMGLISATKTLLCSTTMRKEG